MSDAAQISISKATQKFSLGATVANQYEWSQSSYCDVKFHTQELMPLLVIRGGKSGFAVGERAPDWGTHPELFGKQFNGKRVQFEVVHVYIRQS
jgi:hypothetical protein